MSYADFKQAKLNSIRQIAKSIREDKEAQLMVFVCAIFQVAKEDVLNTATKKKDVVNARKMYCLLMSKLLGMKQEYIAYFFKIEQPKICRHISDMKKMINTQEHIRRKYNEILELSKEL